MKMKTKSSTISLETMNPNECRVVNGGFAPLTEEQKKEAEEKFGLLAGVICWQQLLTHLNLSTMKEEQLMKTLSVNEMMMVNGGSIVPPDLGDFIIDLIKPIIPLYV